MKWLKNLFNMQDNQENTPETTTEEVVNTNETVETTENVEESTEVVDVLMVKSTIETEEFNNRLKEAAEKHLPEEGVNDNRERQVFINTMGRQISNHFPETPTSKVIGLLGLMFEGKYQNDAMLKAIEEMPEGGYGY